MNRRNPLVPAFGMYRAPGPPPKVLSEHWRIVDGQRVRVQVLAPVHPDGIVADEIYRRAWHKPRVWTGGEA